MDNSIKIGKYFRIIAESSDELMKIVPKEKIFALAAHENTTYPFIVYSRSAINTTYTKDLNGSFGHVDRVQVTVDCHGNTYEESVEVANALRNAIEGLGYKNKDLFIERFELISANETTDGVGDWQQILVFQTIVRSRDKMIKEEL